MVTKLTRKKPTTEELKDKLEKAKKALAELEQRTYAGQLEEEIKKTNILEIFNKLKESNKDVSDIVILGAIAQACGLKRLEIRQKPIVKRKPKK